MALLMDTAQFTVKELGLNKVEPANKTEWALLDSVLMERTTK